MSEDLGDCCLELYKKSRPVVQDDACYWTKAIIDNKLLNFRMLTPLDVSNAPESIKYFVSDVGPSIIFPMMLGKIIIGYALRGIKQKKFSVLPFYPLMVYQSLRTYREFSKFKYNTPVILTEGAMDCEYLSKHYPYVFSYLRAEVGGTLLETFSRFTKKIILAGDNDQRGIEGNVKSEKKAHRFGIKTTVILPKQKDWGEYIKPQHSLDLDMDYTLMMALSALNC